MKYYLDTEFHEYKKTVKQLGIGHGYSIEEKYAIDTIELISIGIVSEDGRKFYEICNEFNIQDAWNNKWLKENVLRPIFDECVMGGLEFNIVTFTQIIQSHGKSKTEIAEGIIEFTQWNVVMSSLDISVADILMYKKYNLAVKEDLRDMKMKESHTFKRDPIEFYAYYADYDWVVFCWLFGRMIDLPDGFPMYCIDLKQELDRVAPKYVDDNLTAPIVSSDWHKDYCINELKMHKNYPKQTNEHNALADAEWNKRLHNFILRL